ncbi:unnamed protein product [Chilo suppressalis]|uniref:RING-type domain-containing protein n=1 Tax=Chilo suppressalis TaxID=168631 RepID=A0ABN8AY37_CHISP|nr:unnamed protein product [Chilo suppressalis]
MAEKVKKKPSFFTLKRWNSQKISNGEPSPPAITQSAPIYKSVNNQTAQTPSPSSEPKPRKLSAGGIQDLVQCPLCLEVLHNAKMLPCQHTFCLACLTVYIADLPVINCPICNAKIHVTGPNYVNNLPPNLYIDSLLHLVGINKGLSSNEKSGSPAAVTPPIQLPVTSESGVELFAGGTRCSHCKSMCDSHDVTSCQHCKMNFCRVCWSQHLDDMRTQIASILKQLDSAADRLEHKIEHFKDRCERIMEQINITTEEKINAILEKKEQITNQIADLQKSGDMSALALKSSLEEARHVAINKMTEDFSADDSEKVTTFINLHQNALHILSDVSKWDIEHFVFDKEGFRIEIDSATPLDAESEDPVPEGAKQNNPLESEESLTIYYRSRNFVPHHVWRKASRPGGIGISPWTGHLYVCGMDIHSVLVVERSQAKIISRLTHEDMLCPVQIAFMKSLGEIYITDKWKHCVHVFSMEGEYLRAIGQKGSRYGMFRSPEGIATDNAQHQIYVVDTGNDRVQILQPDGKFVDQLGVITKQQPTNTPTLWKNTEVSCTELNAPTDVAITGDKVIILDSGNKRVKIYNKQNKGKILEFGAMGQVKGQFRQPEVLTVDPLGFILVGDSGNCRVQVFKQNGQLVRVFGGLGTDPGKFGWISGIHVTKQLDIIISDTKNHCVSFF